MKESLFSRLFSYRASEAVSPRENYLTEILGYCLENEEAFRKDFFKAIGVEFNPNISIKTQQRYPEGIPDIEIRTNKTRILIENKIESNEGISGSEEKEDQLPRYRRILVNSPEEYENKVLVYLTKYHDPRDGKAFQGVTFVPLRWHEIYSMIIRTESLVLKELRNYLKEQKMSEITFNSYDLAALQTISGTISKMDEVLEKVESVFRMHFEGYVKDSARSTYIKDGRYEVYKFWGNCTIRMGFRWTWNDGHTYLYLTIYSTKKVDMNKLKSLDSIRNGWYVWEVRKQWGIDNKISLAYFMSKEKPLDEMEKYLVRLISEASELIKSNPEFFH